MRKYKNYTDEQIIQYSKEVRSLSELLKKLGLKPCGGNYINMKKNLQRLNIDAGHWVGQSWSKDKRLKDWSEYKKASSIKNHLIKLRSHKCEACFRCKWLSCQIPLEIHHIDGDRTNNSLKNLQLLCCNCHAMTPNYRNRSE